MTDKENKPKVEPPPPPKAAFTVTASPDSAHSGLSFFEGLREGLRELGIIRKKDNSINRN